MTEAGMLLLAKKHVNVHTMHVYMFLFITDTKTYCVYTGMYTGRTHTNVHMRTHKTLYTLIKKRTFIVHISTNTELIYY